MHKGGERKGYDSVCGWKVLMPILLGSGCLDLGYYDWCEWDHKTS